MEYFINLTAGLEHIPDFKSLDFQFIRIQSTHCEQKHWEKILQDLDNNFLMKLAIGRKCCVFDFTSRKSKKNKSRAIWQGLAWIEYVLYRVWFGREIKLKFGMHMYFREQYKTLSDCTKRKLKYYRKFLRLDNIRLGHICDATDNDGKCEFYQEIVRKYL